MSNEKKGMQYTLPDNFREVAVYNFDYLESILDLFLDLCSYETPFAPKTVIPDHYGSLLYEAREKLEVIQNLYYYGELKEKEPEEERSEA